MNNDGGDIKELNFEFVRPFSQREVLIEDNIVAIPVVHFSDIRANNALVLRNVHQLTKKLRQSAYKHLMQKISESRDKLKLTNGLFNKYLEVEKEQETRLMSSIRELESYLVAYDKKKSKCEWNRVETEKVKEITSNLSLRTVKINELFKSMRSVSRIEQMLEEANRELKANIEFLKVEFQYIDKAYEL
jgi:hypothetical protein